MSRKEENFEHCDLLLEIVGIGALVLHVGSLCRLLLHLLLVRAQLLDDPLARRRLDLQVPQGRHPRMQQIERISGTPSIGIRETRTARTTLRASLATRDLIGRLYPGVRSPFPVPLPHRYLEARTVPKFT